MTELRKAAEQALKYFEDAHGLEDTEVAIKEALREALTETEQEPVAWMHEKAGGYRYYSWQQQYPDDTPLYTAPPWVGLQEQQPVGYAHVEDLKREHHDFWVNRQQGVNEVPLYAAPPKKEWVGLTPHEVYVCWKSGDVVAAVEAKLKEKNR